jgi:hypothetical protein
MLTLKLSLFIQPKYNHLLQQPTKNSTSELHSLSLLSSSYLEGHAMMRAT